MATKKKKNPAKKKVSKKKSSVKKTKKTAAKKSASTKKSKTKSVKKKTSIKKSAKKTSVKKKAAKKITRKSSAKKSPVKTRSKSAKPSAKKTSAKTEKKAPFVAHVTSLKPGMKAPDFAAKDQHGNEIRLSDLAGKSVILFFYPKDDTPGCTAEACSLRDEYQYLSQINYVVLGVSADDEQSHKKFAEKFSLPFSLLADTDKKILRDYDVFGKKQFMGRIFDGIIRTTFVINPEGIIEHVITQVDTANHAKQILSLN